MSGAARCATLTSRRARVATTGALKFPTHGRCCRTTPFAPRRRRAGTDLIIQPTSLAALTWAGAASGTTAQSWRIGAVLSARPLGVSPQGLLVLQIGALTVEAEVPGSQLPAQFQVRVLSLGAQPQLEVLSAASRPDAPARPARTAAPAERLRAAAGHARRAGPAAGGAPAAAGPAHRAGAARTIAMRTPAEDDARRRLAQSDQSQRPVSRIPTCPAARHPAALCRRRLEGRAAAPGRPARPASPTAATAAAQRRATTAACNAACRRRGARPAAAGRRR